MTVHEHPEFVPESFRDDGDYPALAIDMLVVIAYCCRSWPVLATAPIGRCDICGRIPVIGYHPEPSAR